MLEEELEEFRLALRQYMDCACAQTGCLQSVYNLILITNIGFRCKDMSALNMSLTEGSSQ